MAFASLYSECCQPERLREIAWKNNTGWPSAGTARQRLPRGNLACWQRPSAEKASASSFEACCSFTYRHIMGVDSRGNGRFEVHFLPWKSTRHLEADLRPALPSKVILEQRQWVGSQHNMAGYSGVLWPGSLALAAMLAYAMTNGNVHDWRGRGLEVAAGRFALPSLVLLYSKRFTDVLATDLPGVLDAAHSKYYGLRSEALDMCSTHDLARHGPFDFIVASDGFTQCACGPDALMRLSTRDTVAHMVVRSDAGDASRQKFLLADLFLEVSRVSLPSIGYLQPGDDADYVVWRRRFGPHTCWREGFSFDRCCGSHGDQTCFDLSYTRYFCCGL